MTDQFQPDSSSDPKAKRAAARAYAKAQRPLYKKKRVLIPAVIIAIAAFSTASGGGGSSDSLNTANDNASTETDAPAAAAPTAEAPAAEPPAEPAETSGQRNAKRAAENYLDFTAFSREGLIQQLSSDAGDGYSVEDATYGVDAQNADWNEQAYKAARTTCPSPRSAARA